MPAILKIFLLMTGLVFSLSSLQTFAVAQTAEKPVGVEKKANGSTSIPDALKTIVDAQDAAAGQSAQGCVSQPTRKVLVDLVNILIDLLKSDVSRLEPARHEADKKWTSAVEDLKLLLGKQSEKINKLEASSERINEMEAEIKEADKKWTSAVEDLKLLLGKQSEKINKMEASSERINEMEAEIKALSTEARQQRELQGSFSKEAARLSASLAAKRCESGNAFFLPNAQPSDGNGVRLHKKRIAFSTPFASVPVIAAGISALDVANAANTRLSTGVSNVDNTGFDLSMHEYANSHTYGSSAVWMACAN